MHINLFTMTARFAVLQNTLLKRNYNVLCIYFLGVEKNFKKSATDAIYFVSFFISVKTKKSNLRVEPGADFFPEEAVIMESYTARSSHERLRAWEAEVDNVHT